MKIKQITAFLLALLMMLSFAACGGSNNETTAPETTEPEVNVEETTAPEEEITEAPAVEGIDSFFLTLSEDPETYKSINVMYFQDGVYNVEYMGEVRKMGTIDATAVAELDAALQTSGLVELNGTDDYQDGLASGSLYVMYGDGSQVTANFGGVIPEAFTNGFAAIDTAVQALIADIPEYVPQPVVNGEIAESDKLALDAILENVSLEMPDSFMISGVAKDEYFAVTLGLSSDEGIATGVLFKPLMMPGDYSLSIVTLEEGKAVEDVANDFVSAIDWHKNICPPYPATALIATKDNQVLCLMGSEDLYSQTASAIESAGWTTFQTLDNPEQ